MHGDLLTTALGVLDASAIPAAAPLARLVVAAFTIPHPGGQRAHLTRRRLAASGIST